MEETKKKSGTKRATTKKTSKEKVEKPKEEVVTGGFTPEQMAQMQQMMGVMFQTFMQNMSQPQQQEEVKEKKVNHKRINNTPTKRNKSTLRRERGDEDVLVKSISGTVTFKSPKTGVTYSWLEIGDEEWLSVDEVLQMETKSKKFLHEPWLVVMDDEINEVLGIKEITDVVSELDDIDEILEEYTVAEIEEMLNKSSKGYRETFSGIIMNKIRDEELRDGILIKELGRILEINFDLYK